MNDYNQLFSTMRQLGLPSGQMVEMFRGMVFNVAALNIDDHTKNFSFLMNQAGQWSISPAYDLIYNHIPNLTMVHPRGMLVNGHVDNITVDDFYQVAILNDIKNAAEIVDQVFEGISMWRMFAKESGLSSEKTTEIGNSFPFHQGAPMAFGVEFEK